MEGKTSRMSLSFHVHIAWLKMPLLVLGVGEVDGVDRGVDVVDDEVADAVVVDAILTEW